MHINCLELMKTVKVRDILFMFANQNDSRFTPLIYIITLKNQPYFCYLFYGFFTQFIKMGLHAEQ